MREGARGGGVILWVLGALLLIVVAGAGGLGWPVKAFGAQAPAGFTYDLEQLINELEHLTGWDLKDLPRPTVEILSPPEFRSQVKAPEGMLVFAYYRPGQETEQDLILLNGSCLFQAKLLKTAPEAFCRGTLIHELVHWAQTHRPYQYPKGRIERELEAHWWEERYLQVHKSAPR